MFLDGDLVTLAFVVLIPLVMIVKNYGDDVVEKSMKRFGAAELISR